MALPNNPFNEYTHLLEMIEFAVRKEQEAVQFYTDLSRRPVSEEVSNHLAELAAMEEDHRNRLERVDVASLAAGVSPRAADLKPSDYTAEPEQGNEDSLAGLFALAINREIASRKLYIDMADLLPDSMLRQLLQNLAGEEERHRQYLERVRTAGA